MKIISGGQTGVDRAALDVALKHGIECGGWCPVGRLDEFGTIPERYPVKELTRDDKEGRPPLARRSDAEAADRPGGLETAAPSEKQDRFAARTYANVRDSDGTLIIYFEELSGGTEFTSECCEQLHRPPQLIDAGKVSVDNAASAIGDFVRQYKIGVLNIAGPRQSEWPGGYGYAFRALEIFVAS